MIRKTEALRAKRRASLIVVGRPRGKVCEGAQDKMTVETFAY